MYVAFDMKLDINIFQLLLSISEIMDLLNFKCFRNIRKNYHGLSIEKILTEELKYKCSIGEIDSKKESFKKYPYFQCLPILC